MDAMLAEWTLSTGTFFAALAVWIVAQIITGAAAVIISQRVMETRLQAHAEALKNTAQTLDAVKTELAGLGIARAECELRAQRNFTPRGEYLALLASQTLMQERVAARLDAYDAKHDKQLGVIHGRINEIAQGVARIEGARESPGVRT